MPMDLLWRAYGKTVGFKILIENVHILGMKMLLVIAQPQKK